MRSILDNRPALATEINKVAEVALYETYQLTWGLTPADAGDHQSRIGLFPGTLGSFP